MAAAREYPTVVIIGGNINVSTRVIPTVFVLIRVQFGDVRFAQLDWRIAVNKVGRSVFNKDGDFQVLVNYRSGSTLSSSLPRR